MNINIKFSIIACMALGAAMAANSPDAQAQGRSFANQTCLAKNGSVDLKEGGGHGQTAQYWINGAPGKSGACAYTLEICYLGEGRDIPAKTFITTSEGVNLKSEDRILNCDAGWSHFFDGKADGAKSIMVGVGQATQFKARFVSKTPMRIR